MNKLHHPGSPQARCRRLPACDPCPPPHPVLPSARTAFTLTELLVVIAIILGLMTLVSAAAAAARTSQKVNATRSLITRLDTILQSQFRRYASANVDSETTKALTESPNTIPTRSAARAWYIRRNLITGDLPDRWTDVAQIASGTTVAAITTKTVAGITTTGTTFLPLTPSQRSYVSIYRSAATPPTSAYAGAECLFMIIMQGGLADPSDIGPLKTSDIGDKDQDGFQEFWDAWGNPIGYLLWPYAIELPAGSSVLFFSGNGAPSDPFPSSGSSPSPTLRLRPVIYSAGPDGEYSFDRQDETANLNCGVAPVGKDCGNWLVGPTAKMGGLSTAGPDGRADNITNFDAEVKQ
jgi:prepilin-type N-terminal cleavage/methylation domain-containing protein